MRRKSLWMIPAFLLLMAGRAFAFDFSVDGCHYTITSPTTVTLEQIDQVSPEYTVAGTVSFEGRQLTVTALGNGVFTERSVVRRVTLPETITTIYGTFQYCESLEQVNLPNSLRSIGGSAFSQCIHLTLNAWPDSLRSIGEDAFVNCQALKDVVLPAKLETIGKNAFAYSGVTAVHLTSSAVKIGDEVFQNCKNLKSFVLEGDIRSGIPWRMFWNCTALESAEFRGDIVPYQEMYFLASIGREAFSGCAALNKVVIPKNVTFIGSDAFLDCRSLESIDLGEQLKDMESEVFMNSGLKSIHLPETLTSMGVATFWGCSQLESLVLPLRLERIMGMIDAGSGVKRLEVKNRKPKDMNQWDFVEVYDKTTLVVPAGSKEAYAQHEGWGQFKQIEEAAPTVYTFYADISVKGAGHLLWNDQVCTGGERIEVTEGDTVRIRQVPFAEIDSLAWINVGDGSMRLHRDSVYTLVVDDDVSVSLGYITREVEPEKVLVTLRQADLGVVRLAVVKDRSLEFTVNPDEGWAVNCVTLNGEDITALLSDYRILTTGPLDTDAEISISFEQRDPDGIVSMTDGSPLRVRAYAGTLYIDQADPSGIDIFTVDGRMVTHLPTALPTVSLQLPVGKVYIVKNGKRTIKVRL